MLQGTVVLITDAGETPMRPGMAAGFAAGTGDAHHVVNRSDEPAVFLEIGDRRRATPRATPTMTWWR